MKQLFVPYYRDTPVPLSINGHRLILTAREPELFEQSLARLGADHVQELVSVNELDELEQIHEIAQSCDSGIVILPDQLPLDEVIKTLEHDLPWVH